MPEVTSYDASGVSMRLMEVDGILYPKLMTEEKVRSYKDFKGREDDVLIVNYNKSGTHWLWEIVSMMHNGTTDTINKIKQENMFECQSIEKLNAMTSPRVLNTHFRFSKLPDDMKAKRVKMVLIHRNPKDVAVSMYNHHIKLTGFYDYHGKWEDYLPTLFLQGKTDCSSWFDYVQYWEQVMKDNPDYPIHLMFYEDLKEDSTREVKKLAKFLELPLTDDMCAAIADKCQFGNMLKDKKGLESEDFINCWKDGKPDYYRKGEVGDWKNWFTVAQNEMFDKVYKEKMVESKLKFRFEL